MISSIEATLTVDQLTNLIMPVRNIVTDDIYGFEILARGPEGTELENPEYFFKEARRQGCLPLIDFRCIAKSISILTQFPSHFRVFINAYPQTVLHPEFVPWMEQLLDDLPEGGPTLCLEIHESLSLHQLAPLVDPLMELRGLGLEIALDDLRPDDLTPTHWILKPEYIKCDRSVILNLSSAEFDQYIYILKRFEMAYGCQVIVEGIETEQQIESLKRLEVQFAQGFLCGRPASLDLYLKSQDAGS